MTTLLQSNLNKSVRWVILADGTIQAFADTDVPNADLYTNIQQLNAKYNSVQNQVNSIVLPPDLTVPLSNLQSQVNGLVIPPNLSVPLANLQNQVNALVIPPNLTVPLNNLQTQVNNLSIPAMSTLLPKQVAVDASAGTSPKYAAEDHVHAARVQRKIVVLAADGSAQWIFTRPFTTMPSLQYMVFQPSGAPVVVDAVPWVTTGSGPTLLYTGVNVLGKRSQNLPTQTQLSLATLITGVITGVNNLAASLTGFNVFGGGALAGVNVHLSAGDQM